MLTEDNINEGCLFSSPLYKSTVLNELRKQKDDGYFTNFIIEVEDEISKCIEYINVHKNVVCAAVPYINTCVRNENLLENSSKIRLSHLNSAAVKNIIDFIYSGELVLSGNNTIDILIACDYLLMDNLKLACANFYCRNLDLNNCLDIFKIASLYPVENFLKKVRTFISKNTMELLKRHILFKLTFEDIKTILSDDHLLILEDNKYPCSSSRQEFLLLTLLIFLYNSCNNEEEKSIIKELFKSNVVRLSFINEDQLKPIINNLQNDELKVIFTTSLKNNLNNLSKPRILGDIIYKASAPLATPHTTRRYITFNDLGDDNKLGIIQYVTSLKIYLKIWPPLNIIIIGGIKVWYNMGEPILHGWDKYTDHEGNAMPIREVILDDDERIILIRAFSTGMLDSLTFKTNKNRHIGPFGGDGGQVKYIPHNSLGVEPYLASISGIVQRSGDEDDESSEIRMIEFVWGNINRDCKNTDD